MVISVITRPVLRAFAFDQPSCTFNSRFTEMLQAEISGFKASDNIYIKLNSNDIKSFDDTETALKKDCASMYS